MSGLCERMSRQLRFSTWIKRWRFAVRRFGILGACYCSCTADRFMEKERELYIRQRDYCDLRPFSKRCSIAVTRVPRKRVV